MLNPTEEQCREAARLARGDIQEMLFNIFHKGHVLQTAVPLKTQIYILFEARRRYEMLSAKRKHNDSRPA